VIAAQVQNPLQAQGTGSVFLAGDVPHRLEPESQGLVRIGEQCPRRNRNVPLTGLATEHAPLHFPKRPTATLWARPSFRPAQLDKVVATRILGTKLITEFQNVFWVCDHAQTLAKPQQASSA
jgi:hypothetical protein